MLSPSLTRNTPLVDRIDAQLIARGDGPFDVLRVGYARMDGWSWDRDWTAPSRPIAAVAYERGTAAADVLALAFREVGLRVPAPQWSACTQAGPLANSGTQGVLPVRGTRLRLTVADMVLVGMVLPTGAKRPSGPGPVVLGSWSVFEV